MAQSYSEIKKQMEYYLSDKNLGIDKFFHSEIEKSSDGYISLDLFLKCNKIIQLGCSKDDMCEALKDSEEVEISSDKTKIRRKNNKELPELQVRKKVKKQETSEKPVNLGGEASTQNKEEKVEQEVEEKKEEVQETEKKQGYDYDNVQPALFLIKCNQDKLTTNWKQIEEQIEKKFDVKIIYLRFNKSDQLGHFILDKRFVSDEKIDQIVKDPIDIDDKNKGFLLQKGDNKEQKIFWEHHGQHYKTILEMKKDSETGIQDFGNGNNKDGKKDNKKKFEKKHKQIVFANKRFQDINKIKTVFKNILNRTAEGEQIKEPNHTMLLEILKYHDHPEKKLENLKHFTAGVHPQYEESRCFFVVKEDGTKEDFSVVKCIANLQAKSQK